MENLGICAGCFNHVELDKLHVEIPEKNEHWHVECFYQEYEDLVWGDYD